MNSFKLMCFALCSMSMLLMISCTEEGKPNRGLKYMPDMYTSPALKSQESFVVTKHDEDGHHYTAEIPGMALMPEGTVPRHYIPYDYNDVDQGKNLKNPLSASAETLRLGRDKYQQFCSVCHGKEGDAKNGFVSHKFLGIPNINTEAVATYNDGHLFWILSAGRGRMPNYRAQLNASERWAVIHYVRSQYAATIKDMDQRKALKDKGDNFKPLREPIPEYKLKSWPPENAK
ncbi:MAG: cytochrome c [Planctomycetes bacterium]|nr:cytochrome c [Planctomycetota bacterium]